MNGLSDPARTFPHLMTKFIFTALTLIVMYVVASLWLLKKVYKFLPSNPFIFVSAGKVMVQSTLKLLGLIWLFNQYSCISINRKDVQISDYCTRMPNFVIKMEMIKIILQGQRTIHQTKVLMWKIPLFVWLLIVFRSDLLHKMVPTNFGQDSYTSFCYHWSHKYALTYQ